MSKLSNMITEMDKIVKKMGMEDAKFIDEQLNKALVNEGFDISKSNSDLKKELEEKGYSIGVEYSGTKTDYSIIKDNYIIMRFSLDRIGHRVVYETLHILETPIKLNTIGIEPYPPPWIKIEPGCKMPEKGGLVDIWLTSGVRSANVMYQSNDEEDAIFKGLYADWEIENVTHWAPIIPPPGA